MRKIRGFKLGARPKEVLRRCRKEKLDLSALGADPEAALAVLLRRLRERARPSVIFDSFPFEPGAPSPVPGLAYSLALATLGPDLDAFIESEASREPALEPVLRVAARAALEEAVRFVLGLVEAEAKVENCDLSPLHALAEPATLQAAAARLEGHKIGVAAVEGGVRPAHTAAFSASWIARTRSRSR